MAQPPLSTPLVWTCGAPNACWLLLLWVEQVEHERQARLRAEQTLARVKGGGGGGGGGGKFPRWKQVAGGSSSSIISHVTVFRQAMDQLPLVPGPPTPSYKLMKPS